MDWWLNTLNCLFTFIWHHLQCCIIALITCGWLYDRYLYLTPSNVIVEQNDDDNECNKNKYSNVKKSNGCKDKNENEYETVNREQYKALNHTHSNTTAMGSKSSKKRNYREKAPNMSKISNTLSISITEGTSAENLLYRIKSGSILRVHPDAVILGREIILYTNYPAADGKFQRTEYRILDWFRKDGKKITTNKYQSAHIVDTDIYAEVNMNISGTFRFWFHYKESQKKESTGALYIQVEPTLHVGSPGDAKVIPLDSVRCQTVLSKLLGPITTWESKLRVSKESGYNVIHFTPVQELGASRSAYSLRDQLRVNSDFAKSKGEKVNFEDIEVVVKKLREDWQIASICDIVLNHTANESEWLLEHPEATYSCATCPYLRPAFLLDASLTKCGEDIANGLLTDKGVPSVIDREEHLDALKYQLLRVYLPKVNIHELYQCNVTKYVNDFMDHVRSLPPPKNVIKEQRFKEVTLLPDREYKRLGAAIDINLALEIFNGFHADCFDEESRLRKCAEALRLHVESLNEEVRKEIQNYLDQAVDNCLNGVRYERVRNDGPQIKEISEKHPIFVQYFTQTKAFGRSLKQIESDMFGKVGEMFMAHNGWVMDSTNPLEDFAEEQPTYANVYLKRELIAWSDSVKLRYGKSPEDSPFLWQHMAVYVETMARIFDGVRLDNCHSTPIHVAEHLLDIARETRPNLYVVAELFTNSDAIDNVYVNRLGITSLIREALAAWDSHEQGRLIYRFGGQPVGAFMINPKRDLAPSIAHALLMDMTHDNPSPIEKRSVYDLLPSSALVAMACCAIGSSRGYDELVPHHIHIVDEKRTYQAWDKEADLNTGIIAAKRALNTLHDQLAEKGFTQVFVDQMDPNVVAVTRHSPLTHESIILVAHTAFSYPHASAGPSYVRPLYFEGNLDEIVLEAQFYMQSERPFERPQHFERDSGVINGYQQFRLILNEHIPLNKSKILCHQSTVEEHLTKLDFENLKPGCVVVIKVSLNSSSRENIKRVHQFIHSMRSCEGTHFMELQKIAKSLDLVDLNRVLFTCDQEERDLGFGGGVYKIPKFGPLVYCGLQGFISVLAEISPHNDLGHPLCENLRNGNWMMDYIVNRLSHFGGAKSLSLCLKVVFNCLKHIPRYLIPCYFDFVLSTVYEILIEKVYQIMPEFIRDGHNFSQLLALATLQFLTVCKSANMPTLSPELLPPKPSSKLVTLAAGLPHFSTGYMRCWGRDTFISLRGLMFLTGRYIEARFIILGFAQCMRHGLIPNLLDNGIKPRFNCRDAVWWWLFSIKQYVEEAPQGSKLLKDKVSRIFPYNDSEAHAPGKFDQVLIDVMQEAVEVHFQGLLYTERNSGPEIDEHMTARGFNNHIGINRQTGFVHGGNQWNCGTWMDKMGSSEKASNRGRPSTPRDGSAVELVALQYTVLRFMQSINEQGFSEYKEVTRRDPEGLICTWTYKDWADRIKENFEKYFFVSSEENASLANKKNIYKDCYGASLSWTDYQLRCNFPIAMVIAQDLFTPHHAWLALEQAREYLVGPLGIKTLDPGDWNYRGIYDNSNDSSDASVAHGANYHQGPEWVWPMGYYLRARLIFAKKCGYLNETIAETWKILRAHLKELQTSHWRGLPELTNQNGTFCPDSCPTQAWSIASIMEVLYDLHSLGGDV
uniref:Glycogen debranching enzyme n=1 Tax=Glossina brevipalpis TaxID=37001 RepID=A0A1A9WR90_9MUSC